MKIAVMGGAFNPIHNGHIMLADEYSKFLECDKLLLMPTKKSPHKSSAELVADEHRFNMCVMAAKYIRNCEVSDLELKRQGTSYTCDTLKQLNEIYSGSEIFLLCGSDMFLSLQNWKNPLEIFKLATICATKRSNESEETMQNQKDYLQSMGAKIILRQFIIPPFSSTQVRENISDNLNPKNMLKEEIYRYIIDNKLYINNKKDTANV